MIKKNKKKEVVIIPKKAMWGFSAAAAIVVVLIARDKAPEALLFLIGIAVGVFIGKGFFEKCLK